MSCGCEQSSENPCDPTITSPESVASQLNNLTAQLFGAVTKSIVNGRFVWSQPCSASLPFDIYGVTPTEGEGMLCYIIRALKAVPGVATLDIQVFADAIERAAATPAYIGQPGIQLDVMAIYISTGTNVGDWNPFSLVLENVSSGMFTADAAGRSKFAAGFITASLIASLTITDLQLAANCITTSKVLDTAITAAKLAASLDLSSKTVVLPALCVTAGMLATTLDLSSKTLTMPAGHWSNIAPSGAILQSIYAQNNTRTTITTPYIPNDNTIPTSTEGTLFMSGSITPFRGDSRVLVAFDATISTSSGDMTTVALFRGAAASAIATAMARISGAGNMGRIALRFLDSPATTSATTYNIRIGPDAGTSFVNGSGSSFYGGTLYSTLTLQEIKT